MENEWAARYESLLENDSHRSGINNSQILFGLQRAEGWRAPSAEGQEEKHQTDFFFYQLKKSCDWYLKEIVGDDTTVPIPSNLSRPSYF